MQVAIEWGNVPAATRFKVCGISGSTVVDSVKKGAQLAHQLLHVLTNGGHDKPDVNFNVSAKNPRVVAWTNNGLSWVAVSAIGFTEAPYAGNFKRGPASFCSPEAEALGFATDAQMQEHEQWLLSRASKAHLDWLARISWAKKILDQPALLLSLGMNADHEFAARGYEFLGAIWSETYPEKHVFSQQSSGSVTPQRLRFAQTLTRAYELHLLGKICIGYAQESDGATTYIFL